MSRPFRFAIVAAVIACLAVAGPVASGWAAEPGDDVAAVDPGLPAEANSVVGVDHEPTLGNGPTPTDLPVASAEYYVPAAEGAGTSATSTRGAATQRYVGTLPFTGLGLGWASVLGMLAVAGGLALHMFGARRALRAHARA